MDVSKPNEHGVLPEGRREVVARHGRAHAAVNIALCEDRLYRYSTEMHYSLGGFCGPITMNAEPHSTIDAARTAALHELLRRWHQPFPSDPASVREELRILREQVEAQLRQPTLF